MIKDLQLMKDITPLFEKKVIIWGIGHKGRVFIQKMKEMGAGKRGVMLCDSKSSLWGKEVMGYSIMSPDQIKNIIQNNGLGNVVILVAVLSLESQNEIIESIKRLIGEEATIYTEYAVEWGLYLNINNQYVNKEYKKRELLEREICRQYSSKEKMDQMVKAYKYFSFLSLYNNEIILVYQPGKVASTSICSSIQRYGRNVLQCHILSEISYRGDNLYKLLNLKGGKIISLVRDPVARRISEMWQNITNIQRYSTEVDFSEVEKYYFDSQFENTEFYWFEDEMKKTFNIDVFTYPFDKEKGYIIIKQGNIELLLMKMEKLNELEKIIGDFLEIEDFHLQNDNIGKEKLYRFAFDEYKKNFIISHERLFEIYKDNKYMKHFYTEYECEALYKKWLMYAE